MTTAMSASDQNADDWWGRCHSGPRYMADKTFRCAKISVRQLSALPVLSKGMARSSDCYDWMIACRSKQRCAKNCCAYFELAVQFSSASEAGESPLSALTRWRVNIFARCAHRTPVGSTIAKSRIPHDLSARRLRPHAIFVNQSLRLKRGPHHASTSSTSKCIMKFFGVLLVVESLQEET